MINEIIREVKNGNLILFIGAGVPATIGLPTWSQLIEHIGEELGYKKDIFTLYGENLSLAEYYTLFHKGNLRTLVDWMKKKWHVSDEKLLQSEIYKSIVALKCKHIYTTNYDISIERAFKLYHVKTAKIVTIKDLAGLSDDVTQIVKFHGDIHKGNIVLAERDYYERLDFQSPMDIKLRSDMLGKSILFIGYSMSDINVRILLYKLNKMWKSTNCKQHRPKSYIFMGKPNRIQEEIFRSWGVEPIVGEEIDQTKSLEKFLKNLTCL